ncbi:unnamed protein product [[Candida] boidinii]|nr:unnamed protein product [[Candida] boidinii]
MTATFFFGFFGFLTLTTGVETSLKSVATTAGDEVFSSTSCSLLDFGFLIFFSFLDSPPKLSVLASCLIFSTSYSALNLDDDEASGFAELKSKLSNFDESITRPDLLFFLASLVSVSLFSVVESSISSSSNTKTFSLFIILAFGFLGLR